MHWYEDEVKYLESLPKEHPQQQRKVLFYGSSSIRLWETLQNDFSSIHTINRGFGGSTLAACSWFFDRLVSPYQPDAIVLYAGDNDLGDGRHPEEVYLFFKTLYVQVRQAYGNIPFTFISIKPSPARWNIKEQIRYTNKLIRKDLLSEANDHYVDIFSLMLDENNNPKRDLYAEDGLHLSRAGYHLWKNALLDKQQFIF